MMVEAMRRRAAAFLGALVVVAAVSSCVSPAGNDASYRAKAHQSAKAAASEVATVQMVLDLLSRSRITSPYSDELISDSEDAVGSIQTTFGSVQPPDTEESDAIGDQTSAALTAASDAIRDARIAARRSDAAALDAAAQSLDDAADALEAVQKDSR